MSQTALACPPQPQAINDLDRHIRAFDEIDPWRGMVDSGFTTNFLGVVRSVEYFIGAERTALAYAENGPYEVATERPKVADGEQFFEWVDVFAAARAATGSFTMIELGAGYAARSVNAAAALKALNPLPAKFVVVEGDKAHFRWAQEHFANNGLDPADHWFINALVSKDTTPRLFASAAGRYCNMIVDGEAAEGVCKILASAGVLPQAMVNLMKTGSTAYKLDMQDQHYKTPLDIGFVSATDLDTVLAPLTRIDYLDVDIQFAEREVIPATMWQLNSKVKRLHVGTHNQEIHDELETLLYGHGWRPVFSISPNESFTTPHGDFTTSDGILTFENPRLA